MKRYPRLILITFLTTQVDMLAQRGVYFFCHEVFSFGNFENLALAAVGGVAGVVGARSSGRIARRFGPKHALLGLFLLRVVLGVVQALFSEPAVVVVGVTASMFCCFAGWPIIESYISAGVAPAQVSRRIGRFNITWGLSAPLGLALSGPIIDFMPPALFGVSAVLALVVLILALPLERQPEHLSEDDARRPQGQRVELMARLMTASRWLLFTGMTLGIVIAPLLPEIYKGMGFTATWATPVASLLEATRVGMFYVMRRWTFWHERRWVLALVLLGMPVGFVLIVLPGQLAPVLLGQIITGACFAVAYYAALYYAMVLHNASVDASGAHEGVSASGMAVGPGAALLGGTLGQALTPATLGPVLGVAPIYAVCAVATCRALIGAGAREGSA